MKGIHEIPSILLAHGWVILSDRHDGYYRLMPEKTPAGRYWYRWVLRADRVTLDDARG